MTSIKNKFVGIKAFEENSSGLTMYNMLESKFLSNEAVMKNLVGVAHDRGSNIIGSEKGLITLLREKNQNFFDLNDPCHSLNLVIKNSLCKLSTDIKTFVIKIHSYFTSPQRKALLAKIQDENNLATKKLKRYVKTRWLSFGNSLERLVDIWESLQIYMEYMNKNKQVDKKSKSEDEEIVEIDYKWFFDLLNNESFKVQINLLTYIINKLNHFNTTFQNQSLEIQNLKILTNECYKTILKIIVPLAKITNENFSKFPTLDWEKEEIQSLWFMKKEEFIAHISEIPRCSRLSNLSSKEKDQVYKMFVSFLSKMLNLMAKYLPLQDKVIDMLDFVDLKGEFEVNEEKILKFNKMFNVIKDPDEVEELKQELTKMSSLNSGTYRREAKNSVNLWDLVEKDQFIYLPKVARFAQTFPTSSASIEQAFSLIKLIKNDKRYNLSQENIEGQMFIREEYNDLEYINLPNEVVDLYYEMKGELNLRKNGLNSLSRNENNEKLEEEKFSVSSEQKDQANTQKDNNKVEEEKVTGGLERNGVKDQSETESKGKKRKPYPPIQHENKILKKTQVSELRKIVKMMNQTQTGKESEKKVTLGEDP